MDGVAAVRQLLVSDGALTALVPASRIAAGVHPQGTTLPALSLESVSKDYRNIPDPGELRHVVERVQVTALARDYVNQRQVLDAASKAIFTHRPAVSGLANVTIHLDSAGPDFMNEDASIYLGSIDFRVTYSEERTNG